MGEIQFQCPEDDEVRQQKARAASFLTLARRLRAGTGGAGQTPGHVLIREDRDSDHRSA